MQYIALDFSMGRPEHSPLQHAVLKLLVLGVGFDADGFEDAECVLLGVAVVHAAVDS